MLRTLTRLTNRYGMPFGQTDNYIPDADIEYGLYADQIRCELNKRWSDDPWRGSRIGKFAQVQRNEGNARRVTQVSLLGEAVLRMPETSFGRMLGRITVMVDGLDSDSQRRDTLGMDYAIFTTGVVQLALAECVPEIANADELEAAEDIYDKTLTGHIWPEPGRHCVVNDLELTPGQQLAIERYVQEEFGHWSPNQPLPALAQ